MADGLRCIVIDSNGQQHEVSQVYVSLGNQKKKVAIAKALVAKIGKDEKKQYVQTTVFK